jgi:hypothetical protein
MKKIFVIFGENSEEVKNSCPSLFEMLACRGIDFGVIRVSGVDYQTALEIIKEKVDQVAEKFILYAGSNLQNLKNEALLSGAKCDISRTYTMMLGISTDSTPDKNKEHAAEFFSENVFNLCSIFSKSGY